MTNQLIHTALTAILEASMLINKKQLTKDFQVKHKSDNSPVTSVDLACHNIFVKHLTPLGIPILSEEGPIVPFAERKRWSKFWLVDPLDGTKGFIKDRDYSVNLALVEDTEPTIGFIALPKEERVIWTDGTEVFQTDFSGRQTPIETQIDFELIKEQGVNVIQSPKSSVSTYYYEKLQKEYRINQIISLGASLKYVDLVEGKGHIYMREQPVSEWDTASGQAILKAKGIPLIDIYTKRPIQYNKPQLIVEKFLGYSPSIFKSTFFDKAESL